jgi:SPP1 family predicted phage head-tail adaptor
MQRGLGQFRHQVQIQELDGSRTDHGGVDQTYTTIGTAYGYVEPLTGRELMQAQAKDARVSHRIILRYRDGITAKHRLFARSRYFNILYIVNPSERDQELIVLAEERAE